ncbi:hypothetical protein PILCRDRAFT_817778, partial [Piloderma croceum F 1598]
STVHRHHSSSQTLQRYLPSLLRWNGNDSLSPQPEERMKAGRLTPFNISTLQFITQLNPRTSV